MDNPGIVPTESGRSGKDKAAISSTCTTLKQAKPRLVTQKQKETPGAAELCCYSSRYKKNHDVLRF